MKGQIITEDEFRIFNALKVFAQKKADINGACGVCGIDTGFIEIPKEPTGTLDYERVYTGDRKAWQTFPKGPTALVCTKCWTIFDGYQCEKCGLVMNAGEEEVQYPAGTTLCKICDEEAKAFETRKEEARTPLV